MRPGPLHLALALAVGACHGGGDPAPPVVWVGEAGAARIVAVTAAGEVLGTAAEAPALDAPVRALAPLRGGDVLVLQQHLAGGAPPGVLLSRRGERRGALAATDGGGAALFDAAAPPWAAAEAADGRLWVTGRTAPVLYAPDGAFAARAAALPLRTRGIAALPDGRMLVTWGVHDAAAYAADGASYELLAVPLGDGWISPDPYRGLDAVAARPDGTVLVAAQRWGAAAQGVVVAARLEAGRLAALSDPEQSARLQTVPSALALAGEAVAAAPALGALDAPACVERVSADLRTSAGCLLPGAQRGVAVLP